MGAMSTGAIFKSNMLSYMGLGVNECSWSELNNGCGAATISRRVASAIWCGGDTLTIQ